jgi:hypothetical protein
MSKSRSPVSLYSHPSIKLREFGELLRPARAEAASVTHHCASPNKQPWPKCCREASAAFSKEMEERYFREKLNM